MKPRKGRQLVEFDQTFHPSHRHQIVKVKHLNGSRVKKTKSVTIIVVSLVR